jgi:hypothetical protein
MKTSLLILFILISAVSSFGQIEKTFKVKELDSIAAQDTLSKFKHHPVSISIKAVEVNDFAAYRLDVTLTYEENFQNSPFYIAKSTYTSSTLIIPKSVMDFEKTIDKATHKFILPNLNQILSYFGLLYNDDLSLTVPSATTPNN